MKNFSEFKYKEVCINGNYHISEKTNGNPSIKELNEINELFSNGKTFDLNCYCSIYEFDNNLCKYIDSNKKIQGFSGVHYCRNIIIDFDNEDNLESVLTETLNFIDYLIVILELNKKDVNLYFSGCKGFHIYINTRVFGDVFNPNEYLYKIVQGFVKNLVKDYEEKTNEKIKYLDYSIYNTSIALIRIPNTRHKKTNLYKFKIELEELEKFETIKQKLAYILEKAKIKKIDNQQNEQEQPEYIPKVNDEITKILLSAKEQYEEEKTRKAFEEVNFKKKDYFEHITDKELKRLAQKFSFNPKGWEIAFKLLLEFGWEKIRENGEYIYLKRPGKIGREHSASWNGKILYNFSTNATGFNVGVNTPFDIFKNYSGYNDNELKDFINETIQDDGTDGSDGTIDEVFGERYARDVFIELFAGEVVHLFTSEDKPKKWYIWNGRIWEQGDAKIYDYTEKLIIELYKRCSDFKSNDRIKFISYLKNLEKFTSREKLLKLCAVNNRIRINEINLAINKIVLNNGTIIFNKEGFEFTEQFFKNDYCTNKLDIDFNYKATCPNWKQFLNDIFEGDNDLIEFVQKGVGLTLSGDTSEDVVFFCYGKGANGKSTFIETMKMLFSIYYGKTHFDTFCDNKYKSTPLNELAVIKDALFVSVTEIDNNKRFKVSTLKDVSSGENIVIKFLYQDITTTKTRFKLWFSGNYKPSIDTDDGTKRRLKLIPFLRQFQEHERKNRKELLDTFKSELPGILLWALDGYNKYRKDGLKICEKVKEYTEGYFNENDTIQAWLNDNCIIGDTYNTTAKDLFENYKRYLEQNEERVNISQRKFNMLLENKGFKIKKPNNIKTFNGVGIKV